MNQNKGRKMNKILQMLELQQELNDATNGLGWENGVTKNGKLIDWKRCAFLECAELIESYPWKHWKNIEALADTENIKIEAVDIWHFIMSQALTEYKVNNQGNISDLAHAIANIENFKYFTQKSRHEDKDYYTQIKVVEALIKSLFVNDSTEILISKFIEVAMQSNLDLDSLYTLYIGKNILNTFRQKHGYKEGSYIKIWQGKEDNVVMQNILEQKELTALALYQALEDAYAKNLS